MRSIPDTGEKTEAKVISRIGEIKRFNHSKKLVDFAIS
ncbi:transposase [Lederbergia lenta]